MKIKGNGVRLCRSDEKSGSERGAEKCSMIPLNPILWSRVAMHDKSTMDERLEQVAGCILWGKERILKRRNYVHCIGVGLVKNPQRNTKIPAFPRLSPIHGSILLAHLLILWDLL